MATNFDVAVGLTFQVVVSVNIAHRFWKPAPQYEANWLVDLLVVPTWTVWLVIIPLLFILVEDKVKRMVKPNRNV